MYQLRSYPGFDQLPEAFRQWSLAAAAQASVWLTPQWFAHLAASLGGQARMRLYALSHDAAPCALLAMRELPRRWWQARQLSAMANFYSALTGPLLSNQSQLEQALHALASALRAEGWDSIDLHPLAQEQGQLEALAQALRSAGLAVQAYFCFGNWYLPVAGRSYQAYFDGLPARLRNTVTRRRRQLQAGDRLRLEIVQDGPPLEAAIAAYQQVYGASWKQPEPYPDFVPGLIRLCAAQGWLRLGLAHVDGQPAAAQLWIVRGGVASIYKLAYDQRHERLSIGSILTAHLMRHALDVDRVHEVDYLNGDEAYKQDWMSHRRERWGLRAFNPRRLHGALGALRHVGGQRLRAWLTKRCQALRPCGENAGKPRRTQNYVSKKENFGEPMV